MKSILIVLSLAASAVAWADDTTDLQRRINQCGHGAKVELEPVTYTVGPLTAKSDCTYEGVAGKTILRLRTPNQFILDLSGRSDVSVLGITFDGNSLGGAIAARGYTPASGITIENCTFTGVSGRAVFPANIAIFSSWALTNASVRGNRFTNVAAGLWFTAVDNVKIENNVFQQVTQGNAIYIAPNPVEFPSGRNLRIAGNKGSELARMGIEIFRPDPPNGSVLIAPVIENNEFSGWTSSKDGFGLSITHGDGAIVRHNIVRNPNRPPQYAGIEIIARNALVEDNSVEEGFAVGIVVQGADAPKILNNRIRAVSDIGIVLACDGARHRCSSRGALIERNSIVNARRIGIKLDNDWSDSKVINNTITRTGGFWPDDDHGAFAGVHQSPAPGHGVIDFNTVVQDAKSPPAGFGFSGILVNSPMPGSSISDNVVRSESETPLGIGVLDNTGSATAPWLIRRDRFVNLAMDRR